MSLHKDQEKLQVPFGYSYRSYSLCLGEKENYQKFVKFCKIAKTMVK